MKRVIPVLSSLFVIVLTGSLDIPNLWESSDNVSLAKLERIPEYRRISPDEAKELMSGEFILLDVRTEEEFIQERLEGAILIPDYELDDRAADELPDKNALILIYCRSGRRSANAAWGLVGKGYTNIYDFGGIIDWPYDTVSG